MNILALNCGSSSLKYQLFDFTNKVVIASGLMERIGTDSAKLKHLRHGDAEPTRSESAVYNHEEALKLVLDAVIVSLPAGQKIEAVGHRVVHGGSEFARSVEINEEVTATIERLIPLAPLHNPANLSGIRASMHLLPGVRQVAIFDTAFHQTMPPQAYTYAVPRSWIDEFGARRYGFHGTSHLYASRRVAQLMGRSVSGLKIITCHIGNGASLAAVLGGRSIDTTMGLTPLEGMVMGTRSGDIDPGLIPYVMKQTNQSFEQVFNALNKDSGMLGLTGHSDLRDVEACHMSGEARCTEALETYTYRIKKKLGAYAAAMNGVDVIVFTAGVGENSSLIREMSLSGLSHIGVRVDEEANRKMVGGKEGRISVAQSPVTVAVLKTNEELMIVEDTAAILRGVSPADPGFRYSFESEPAEW